jgi:uncharacterized membrane protein YqiK
MLAVLETGYGSAWEWGLGTAMLGLLLVLKCGFVLIREQQVGVMVKRFAAKSLPPGRLIALAEEAGFQADTLAPGLHFGYWPWQYRILKMPVTVVPQGEIALVLAVDGDSIPAGRILGKMVECDNFQNARKFLANGGEKGRQLGILTAGTYRINPALFTVITSVTADLHGMNGRQLELTRAGVESIGAQGYTVMQLMQIVGECNVRIVPDVAVSGQNSGTGLVDGLLGVMLHQQAAKPGVKQG